MSSTYFRTIKLAAFTLAASAVVSLPQSMLAQNNSGEVRTDYFFRAPEAPLGLTQYSFTVYPFGKSTVLSLQGAAIANLSQLPLSVSTNPTGIHFAVVGAGKKGKNSVKIYDTREVDNILFEIDTKKYGNPAYATYAPTSGQLVVATDLGLQFFETKKYQHLKSLQTPFAPMKIAVSPNEYFAALTDGGSEVCVMNLEQGTVRKSFKLDGYKVTEIAFSPDNSQFAILSDDGMLSIYNTRDFSLRKMVSNLGEGRDCAFNFDGKYMAVATDRKHIKVVNLADESDVTELENPDGTMNELLFIPDSRKNTLLCYTVENGTQAKRMMGLQPFYARLVADEVADKMRDWMKMMPGESMTDYQTRVNETTRGAQQQLFENEISTNLANNMLEMAEVKLGKYDRSNQVLEVNFDNMPTIALEVPEEDVMSFANGGDLEFTDAQYGLMDNDKFELIYANVRNKATGKSYVYNNLARKPLTFVDNDENTLSLEVVKQQHMEEVKLEEIRQEVVEEAKKRNVISDHTNIAVNSQVLPEYDADGKRILNYKVNFDYQVDPEFSAVEDFGPGKYHVAESGAANSMLTIVSNAFANDFAQYLKPGKKLKIKISGTADATPIIRTIPYDGSFGEFVDEPVRKNNELVPITVTRKSGATENPQLAYLRAQAVRDHLQKNIPALADMKTDFEYNINVSESRGSAHRRITVEFIFIDAL